MARYIGPHVSAGIGSDDPGAYWEVLDQNEDLTQYKVPLPDRDTVIAWTTTPAAAATAKRVGLLTRLRSRRRHAR